MQAFLHQRQDLAIAASLRIDHAVWMKPHRHEARGKQILAGQTPQNRTFEAGENAACEKGGCPGKFGGRAMLDHFVQRA